MERGGKVARWSQLRAHPSVYFPRVCMPTTVRRPGVWLGLKDVAGIVWFPQVGTWKGTSSHGSGLHQCLGRPAPAIVQEGIHKRTERKKCRSRDHALNIALHKGELPAH